MNKSNAEVNTDRMPAAVLIDTLRELGFTVATGVPCSLLAGLFSILENLPSGQATDLRYVPAPREDSAIGVASGVAVTGGRAVVMMQNSGLGYSLNVLTSFNLIYDVPILLIVSWRGSNDDDAIEHKVIGRKLPELLRTFSLPYLELDVHAPRHSVQHATTAMASTHRPSVLLVKEPI